eukprot:766921-Hanusia_phi.AAC.1
MDNEGDESFFPLRVREIDQVQQQDMATAAKKVEGGEGGAPARIRITLSTSKSVANLEKVRRILCSDLCLGRFFVMSCRALPKLTIILFWLGGQEVYRVSHYVLASFLPLFLLIVYL